MNKDDKDTLYYISLMFPENCTWEKLTPAFTGSPTPRAAHGMCAVGSKLVIFGGRDSVGRKNDLFVLDTGNLICNLFFNLTIKHCDKTKVKTITVKNSKNCKKL